MAEWSRTKVVYGLAVLAMLSVSGGFAIASGLTSTSIAVSSSLFSVSLGGSTAFPSTPTVIVGSVPAAVASCTSGPATLASGGTPSLYLPASAGVACTSGDFAVVLNFTSSATAGAGSYTFTVYDSYGTGPTSGSASASVVATVTLTSSATVSVYVDFGSATPPAGGIGSLSLVV